MKGKAEYVQLEHNEWPKRYEACGDAVEQSPIHVHYLDSRFLQFKPLYFAGFENHYSYVVENGMHGREHDCVIPHPWSQDGDFIDSIQEPTNPLRPTS
ncbi:hypothetical protein V5799_020729 [Amblyomma americanum]|uniref:Uncharacterized protein n=1 Tax=Amblyomma americanum TaxID=6943 RepID=A0AAQ4ETX7_AMBAM